MCFNKISRAFNIFSRSRSLAKNLHEKPSYSKIWKQKLKAMNPFHKKGDEPWVAVILAFLAGQWGAHKFYQGDKKGGFTMLGITLGGYALYFVGYIIAAVGITSTTAFGIPIAGFIIMALGGIMLAVTGIWAFVDFIRLLIAM